MSRTLEGIFDPFSSFLIWNWPLEFLNCSNVHEFDMTRGGRLCRIVWHQVYGHCCSRIFLMTNFEKNAQKKTFQGSAYISRTKLSLMLLLVSKDSWRVLAPITISKKTFSWFVVEKEKSAPAEVLGHKMRYEETLTETRIRNFGKSWCVKFPGESQGTT